MRTELVDEMVKVDEEDFDFFDFFEPFVGVGGIDHDIEKFHVVDENAMVEFLHLNDVVEIFV